MTKESYTPTTARVLDAYIWCDMGSTSDEWDAARTAEFDRWLDQVKAEARREGQAEAWNAGWTKGIGDTAHRGKWNDDGDLVVPRTPNPYEEYR